VKINIRNKSISVKFRQAVAPLKVNEFSNLFMRKFRLVQVVIRYRNYVSHTVHWNIFPLP
jgi:hypothetical protein